MANHNYKSPYLCMMNRIFIILFCFFFCGKISAQESKDIIRLRLFAAVKDASLSPALLEDLYQIKPKDELTLGYIATTEALMAKNTWNPFRVFHHLNQSKKFFDSALKNNMQNIEIRFMRLSVEENLPSYLGYSKHIDEDSKFILEHLDQLKQYKLNRNLSFFIVQFLLDSGFISKERSQKVISDLG